MSNVNVRRAVENIRSGTNVYTPLVETIVNAIQAIEAGSAKKGFVDILVKRSNQQELEGGQPPVESFTVIDNGVGFNDENRDSFDTLYSDHKIAQGGKGFGRFTCLKYFDDLLIKSVFEGEEGRKKRAFNPNTPPAPPDGAADRRGAVSRGQDRSVCHLYALSLSGKVFETVGRYTFTDAVRHRYACTESRCDQPKCDSFLPLHKKC